MPRLVIAKFPHIGAMYPDTDLLSSVGTDWLNLTQFKQIQMCPVYFTFRPIWPFAASSKHDRMVHDMAKM